MKNFILGQSRPFLMKTYDLFDVRGSEAGLDLNIPLSRIIDFFPLNP